jgi:hypothetical protein
MLAPASGQQGQKEGAEYFAFESVLFKQTARRYSNFFPSQTKAQYSHLPLSQKQSVSTIPRLTPSEVQSVQGL